MASASKPLWPYSARASLLAAPIILVLLTTAIALMRGVLGWPTAASERTVLVGVSILSLTPLFLAVIDNLATQRAVLEFKGLKLDFARMARAAPSSMGVASNIGVPGQPITDSSTTQILDALRDATDKEVVVLDLEDGHAWWETRLLVLLCGAARLAFPQAVVFVATKAGRHGQFVGWAPPDDLLSALLRSDALYQNLYDKSAAAAAQWALVEPADVGLPTPIPASLNGLAATYFWMAFDGSKRNPLGREQLLASELGSSVEVSGARYVTITRLEELFVSRLRTRSIDRAAAREEQVRTLQGEPADYIAVTADGQYEHLTPYSSILLTILRSMEQERTGVGSMATE